MDAMHPTVVTDNSSIQETLKESQQQFANLSYELQMLREQEGWKRFGTIGFDAYKSWVLENR